MIIPLLSVQFTIGLACMITSDREFRGTLYSKKIQSQIQMLHQPLDLVIMSRHTIQNMCMALGNYYVSRGRDWENGKFSAWCNDNSIDEDLIMNELDVQEPSDCVLCEFDGGTEQDFPASDGQAMLKVLKLCYYAPGYDWDPLPKCMLR